MKPGDTVMHKYTGTKFVVLSVNNGYACVQTKPGMRTWVFPVGVLRPLAKEPDDHDRH